MKENYLQNEKIDAIQDLLNSVKTGSVEELEKSVNFFPNFINELDNSGRSVWSYAVELYGNSDKEEHKKLLNFFFNYKSFTDYQSWVDPTSWFCQHFDINAGEVHQLPIYYAMMHNNMALVLQLINRGAKFNFRNEEIANQLVKFLDNSKKVTSLFDNMAIEDVVKSINCYIDSGSNDKALIINMLSYLRDSDNNAFGYVVASNKKSFVMQEVMKSKEFKDMDKFCIIM
jgi:hypothetical protein